MSEKDRVKLAVLEALALIASIAGLVIAVIALFLVLQ